MENKSICAICKHCKKKMNAEYNCDYKCKLYGTLDAVTGKYDYDDCYLHNFSRCNCEDFVPS